MSDAEGPRSRPLEEVEATAPQAEAPRAEAPHSLPLEATRLLPVDVEARDPADPPRRSLALRLVLAGGGLLLGGALALLAEDLIRRALEPAGQLAWIGLAGLGLLALGLLLAFLREWHGLTSLERLRAARLQAESAEAAGQPDAAQAVVKELKQLYNRRADMEWALRRVEDQQAAAAASGALLPLAERELLAPLDQRAQKIAVSAVRRAAMITAISPFALLDMLVSLMIGLGLLRRIARIYGGRPGWLGAWRLLRLSLAQVLASGALDLADDSIGDLIGAGIASRLSRRAGVGLLNGLLTARIATAAMDLCRPFPWDREPPPSARGLLRRALTDLGGSKETPP
ncbi:TIGR01620 family protein [Aquibaculum arenosum]|uniref:TIGR01620 family protein n=1 Tax=Aquibaculum arenosum TaxID=3032591 RepID=A0ABT5YL15_9PROT|nr:TIGR01620 family protein [Fodinicurvata sp. CAU 1616]MDF2095516.1 TIGR01620 family protein [Fodinicurvata sp. CAU 1616]